MSETVWVRVKDKSTGHKFSVIESAAQDENAYQILKQDAVDVGGNPLPPEYASESTSGQSATNTPKEK